MYQSILAVYSFFYSLAICNIANCGMLICFLSIDFAKYTLQKYPSVNTFFFDRHGIVG